MNVVHAAVESFARLSPAERVGWVLLHSLWQELLVAVLLAAALLFMRRRSASARYLVCCAAMLMMAALPVATGTSALAATRVAGIAPDAGAVRHSFFIAPHGLSAAVRPPDDSPAPLGDTLHPLLRSLSYSWLAGICALSLWHLLGWVVVQRLKHDSPAAPAAWQRKLAELARRLRVTARVALRVCDRVGAPAVVGWVRPVVLLPACALTGLPPAQLEALLLHELAHIRRHDYLINLLQTAAETLLFYHPAVWWVGRQIRHERENCCDDVAATHCGGALPYARSLAAMETLRGAVLPALAMGSDGGNLRRRIERLLAPPTPRRQPKPFALGMLAVAAGACLWLAGNRPSAHAADRGSTTRSASAATQPEGIRPQDLAAEHSDYTIHPNDLIAVTLTDLAGPGKETIKQCRVSESGKISLPYLKDGLKAVGRTEAQLEQDIASAYREAHLIANEAASVTVLEARGRGFNILGHVAKPGEYAMPAADFRLLDAIAMAGGTAGAVDELRIVRRPTADDSAKADQPRTINLLADRLLGGGPKLDPKFNLFVRAGDTILVLGPDQATRPSSERFVRLVVGKDSLTFEGKKVTWEQMPDLLRQLHDRQATILEIAAESDEVTVGRYFDAEARAAELVRKYELKGLNQAESGVAPGAKADAGGGVVYIGGHVKRPGAYALDHKGITLMQVILAAGGPDDDLHGPQRQVTLIQQNPAGKEKIQSIRLDDLIDPAAAKADADVPLHAGDKIMVGVSKATEAGK